MEQPKDPAQPSATLNTDTGVESAESKKPYVAPRLELLDIEATRNGPGSTPDAGVDYS